ncbi:uncharacterized protein N7483_003069 [Penicillium malachiteum]|uniref:uncharacterized protein n=1 Tax=Penicillium malachiteum TaxID=1324776 RepID=UPI002548DC17|nr:uncharacterized protein N7483_003069 [Penicillium malachiteum]KAJ5728561.1 hypothetical protein N7483_003069 [Penicillium malachiteum]
MTSKRRGAAAQVSPEVKLRSQKRRKVSDEDLEDIEESNRDSSEPVDEPDADESSESEDEAEPETEFEGDSMQTAQDKILTELFRLKDEDGEEVAYPFVGKPDRALYRDYYEIIQYPVSLRSIQKKVRGTDGRKKGTGMTAFPTWQSFADEVSYLWRNAREYNEDGSEIAALAGVMEEYFDQRVAEVRRIVPDPIQVDGHPELPRIRLKVGKNQSESGPQRLTLKMAGQTFEPPKDNKTPSGVTVDNDSLKRQQELIRTESMSQEADTHHLTPRTRSLRGQKIGSPKSSTGTTPSTTEQSHGATGVRDASGGIKSETPLTSSQRFDMRGPSHGPSGVPSDSAGGLFPHDNLIFNANILRLQLAHMQPPVEKSPIDSIWRRAGQDATSALIRNVQIATHSSLSLKDGFYLNIPPSSKLSQQTIAIPLPSSHTLLTVKPTLILGSVQRQVKMIAHMGMQHLHPTGEALTPAYDIQLHPGITRVDFEAIAGPARGAPKSGPPGSEVDYERVTIFFNLLR